MKENLVNSDGLSAETIQRLEEKLTKVKDGCWPWMGASRGDVQSANFSHPGGRIEAARRVAYKLWIGPIPVGRSVLLTCMNHNIMCMNPAHFCLSQEVVPPQLNARHIARFWEKVDKSGGPDACWPWIARAKTHPSKTNKKVFYGQFSIGHYVTNAHTVAYAISHGVFCPAGLVVRHTCSNSLCCNPKHLIPGTDKDNAQDKMKAGRANFARGESAGMAKLTEAQVLAIRSRRKEGLILADIAKEFNVCIATVGKICQGDAWAHVA